MKVRKTMDRAKKRNAAKCLITDFPKEEQNGWSKAFEVYQPEFLRNSVFLEEGVRHEMAKRAACVYGLANASKEPTKQQIEMVHPIS